MKKPLKREEKGECPLLRGYQFKMVSGQGKWQEWMPKLERSRSDLRKPCYPRHAGIPASEEHGSRSHPDNVWFRRNGRALLRGRFSEPPKPQGTWEDMGPGVYRSQPGLFAVCCQTRCQGGPLQQLNVIVAHRDEYTPRPRKVFDLHLHRFQMKCCRAWIVFFGGLHTFKSGWQFQLHNKFNRHCEDLFIISLSRLMLQCHNK